MAIESLTNTMPVGRNIYSATVNQIMKDNPDLSHEFLRQLLIAQAEVDADMVEPYEFG